MKLLLENRNQALRVITCLFFAVGMVLSFNLWTSERSFPLCPVSDLVPQFSPELSVIVAIVLVLALLLGVVWSNRWVFIAILSLLFLLFIQDQMRWQPWAYMYGFLLIPFALKKTANVSLTYFQLILIGVYLWSGIHKLSPDFIDFTFLKMLKELFGIENEATLTSLRWVGYTLPIIEVLVAFALVFRKTRLMGVVGAILTHVFILIYLIKIDFNSIVYPWNIAMIVFVIVLFYRNEEKVKILEQVNWRFHVLNAIAALLFVILPVLNFFHSWDHYLSFSLYSGKTHQFFISIADSELDKIDRNLHNYFWNSEELRGGEMISIQKWSMDELNVPFYPETRLFKQVTNSFCGLGIDNDLLIAVEFERSMNKGAFQEFKCSDLE